MDDNQIYIGPGAVREPKDERDLPFRELVASGAVPAVSDKDWAVGFSAYEFARLKPQYRDQGKRLSCTCEAAAEYGRVLRKLSTGEDVTFSATSVYPSIALPDGGAYIREAARALAEGRFATKASVPDEEADGTPVSEVKGRDASRVTAAAVAEGKRLDSFDKYRVVEGQVDSIDIFAAAIRTGYGLILGFTGTNNGWCRCACRPPASGEYAWGHAVFGGEFGELDVPCLDLPVDTRCLFIPNSWGGRYGITSGRWKGRQAIPASYFPVGNPAGQYVFPAWTVTPASVTSYSQATRDFCRIHERKALTVAETGAKYLVLGPDAAHWEGRIMHVSAERAGLAAWTAVIDYGIGQDRRLTITQAELGKLITCEF